MGWHPTPRRRAQPAATPDEKGEYTAVAVRHGNGYGGIGEGAQTGERVGEGLPRQKNSVSDAPWVWTLDQR